jgi:uncharacterized protein Yka (UPF0111/DUF47 family)
MLNRMDDRNKSVSTMRINQCHKIQEDSVQVMKEVSGAINEHHRAIDGLNHTVGELKDSVEKNTHKIEQLILK